MKTLQLQSIVYKEDKHYVAQCLNIDVSSFGPTKKEALANLHEALELYLEDTKNPALANVESPEFAQLTLQDA